MSQPSCLCQLFDITTWSKINLFDLVSLTNCEGPSLFSVSCVLIEEKSWKGSEQEMNNHKAIKNDVTIQLIAVYHHSHVTIRYFTIKSLRGFHWKLLKLKFWSKSKKFSTIDWTFIKYIFYFVLVKSISCTQ